MINVIHIQHFTPPPQHFCQVQFTYPQWIIFLLTGENMDENGLTTHSLSQHFINASCLGFLNLFLRKKGAYAPI